LTFIRYFEKLKAFIMQIILGNLEIPLENDQLNGKLVN